MQLASRPVDRPIRSPVSAFNRKVYRRLKLALELNLRRQIFLAVCDDLTVRNWLAAQLHAELAWPHDRLQQNGQLEYPRLVSLWLNLQNPNPIAQVALWMQQHPAPQASIAVRPPEFQIIGVERLTQYPACMQQAFLNQLQQSERAIAALDSTLLLWLPRPWLGAIQQSAPALWQCHTALFEFEGDPMPEAAIEPAPLLLPAALPQNNGQHQSAPTEDLLLSIAAVPQSSPKSGELVEAVGLGGQGHHATSEITIAETEKPALLLPAPATEAPPDAELLELPLDEEYLRTRPEIAAALVEIEQHPQTEPALLAQTYRQLGDRLRDRVTQGDTAEQTLVLTIQAYEQSLVWSEAAPHWAEMLNDIGNLYWMLSRQTSQTEMRLPYLEQAIVAYELAATKSDRQSQSHVYALIQSNLGSVYGDLAQHRDRAECLQQAAAAYEETLRYRTLEAEPDRHAATQNNLGTTYWNLAQHQHPVQNLQQAIAAYRAALRYYSPEREPLHYAMLQNNLGTAYWNLAQHKTEQSPSEGLQQAIAAYQAALVYRTLETVPAAFAATQNNLGTAFWHLATSEIALSDRGADLEQAIAAYSACLSAVQSLPEPAELTFDPIAARHQLGLAYQHRAIDPSTEPAQRIADLEAALYHHLQALEGWKHSSELAETAFLAIVQTVKAFYTQFGLKGHAVLSKVPAHLLPRLMRLL